MKYEPIIFPTRGLTLIRWYLRVQQFKDNINKIVESLE